MIFSKTCPVQHSAYILFRGLVIFALLWQALLPGTQAAAREAGFDVRAYMCSPQSAPSDEVTAQLTTVLKLAGKFKTKTPGSDVNPDHCSNCIITSFAILPQLHSVDITKYDAPALLEVCNIVIVAWGLRGPPLGSRAPPSHV